MLLMKLENSQPLQIRALPKQQGQQVIPPLSAFLNRQQLLKSKSPQIEPLFSKRLRRNQESGFAFGHRCCGDVSNLNKVRRAGARLAASHPPLLLLPAVQDPIRQDDQLV